ncbi:GcrA family cell cycle regulator [Caulobacter endophyticus]|uniref:GcrA family cell cycle regulator n=1 Tax=Caulobacter endophyticus TaxID=2172652 RepID=UPI00240EDD2C|nr:GcrA family cell cycle regulator [Caulobacter endophyticus]MDG2528190.1 GcrA family cell cycle regulator [Caulobacter endophyticus]
MSSVVKSSAAEGVLPAVGGWSDARVARLKALLAQGLSARQIAQALGAVSRNAVIGKIHRLGLAGGGSPSAPGRRARLSARPRLRRKAPSPPPPPPCGGAPAAAALARPRAALVDAVGLAADLAALPRQACRWPIGDPREGAFSWCGRPVARTPTGRASYCEGHRARAYRARPIRGVAGL